jgi:hypothetical protein
MTEPPEEPDEQPQRLARTASLRARLGSSRERGSAQPRRVAACAHGARVQRAAAIKTDIEAHELGEADPRR